MKISIVVPAYNEQNYIGLLLDSILGQTRHPDEIIICNNNSTDNTVKVIQKYQSLLPIKIVSEPKKGIRFAVEKAWRSSSGDLILKTDADCVLPSNWVKNYEQLFIRSPELSAAGGGFFASDGNLLVKILAPLAVEINRTILYLVKGYLVLFGGNCAIKRSFLLDVNGYLSEEQSILDDGLISKKFHDSHAKIKVINNPCFTSVRSFSNTKNAIRYALSAINHKFYLEKSN